MSYLYNFLLLWSNNQTMKISRTIALLLLFFAVYWTFRSMMPDYVEDSDAAADRFSTDRAMAHVEQLSREPHAVGFPGHARSRAYIISELKKMGLETRVQEGYTAGDWGNLSKATNILSRLEGSGNGKALLLLSHYDSSPHSSLGASDAGSGVATILEGVRAYLESGRVPVNDVIILLTDAEELGLNGADLFVNGHPWAKEVGLVLNFEARGSGGPGYMLIETNRGNSRLIEGFSAANVEYPVANSLVYSIYKMLPNDTDLTVFREDADIEGLNFAFIDDHFDYHTVLDRADRLDRNTLAHQGSYLMPLLEHFGDADLGNLKSLKDDIYFNLPFFKLVHYPFEWIWPMFALAVLAFLVLLALGLKKGSLGPKSMLKGFVPLLLSMAINGLAGYTCWMAVSWWYPGFGDMLHGFTYNGYTYIAVYVALSLAVCFHIYHRYRKIGAPDLLVAPIVVWGALCGLLAAYVPGGSFFIIPVFALLAAFMVCLEQKEPNPYLLVFLALPAVLILSPFVKMFPVGLGLKMMVGTTLLTTLLFFMALPFFGTLKSKGRLSYIFLLLFFGFGISSHIQSDFNDRRPKPSSLVYLYDADSDTALWATYDKQPIGWNGQFLGEGRKKAEGHGLSSKYGTRFSFVSEAPKKNIPLPHIETTRDTLIGEDRLVEVCITPRREVNRLEVHTNGVPIKAAWVNRVELSSHFLANRGSKLVTHYVSNRDFTELELRFPKDSVLELSIHEASNDLLTHPEFSIPERPDNSIPMPFVLNDAVATIKTLRFE